MALYTLHCGHIWHVLTGVISDNCPICDVPADRELNFVYTKL